MSDLPISCPACGSAAELVQVEAFYGRQVTIDVCAACGGLWLDGLEGMQPTPGGLLELLRRMDNPERTAAQARPDPIRCPRCGARLLATEDRQRDTNFAYYRCPKRHGRFMTFFQFLRSRNFVRELTAEEIRDLREKVQSVNCAGCGAPVDVRRGSVCAHCGLPISTVAPGQIRRAIEEALAAEEKRHSVDPALPLRLLAEKAQAEKAFAGTGVRPQLRWSDTTTTTTALVEGVVRLIERLLPRSRG